MWNDFKFTSKKFGEGVFGKDYIVESNKDHVEYAAKIKFKEFISNNLFEMKNEHLNEIIKKFQSDVLVFDNTNI